MVYKFAEIICLNKCNVKEVYQHKNSRLIYRILTSRPLLLMSKPSPQICTPLMYRMELDCLMSQTWTTLSQPPEMNSVVCTGWNVAAKTRELCPSTTDDTVLITIKGCQALSVSKAFEARLPNFSDQPYNLGVWNIIDRGGSKVAPWRIFLN